MLWPRIDRPSLRPCTVRHAWELPHPLLVSTASDQPSVIAPLRRQAEARHGHQSIPVLTASDRPTVTPPAASAGTTNSGTASPSFNGLGSADRHCALTVPALYSAIMGVVKFQRPRVGRPSVRRASCCCRGTWTGRSFNGLGLAGHHCAKGHTTITIVTLEVQRPWIDRPSLRPKRAAGSATSTRFGKTFNGLGWADRYGTVVSVEGYRH